MVLVPKATSPHMANKALVWPPPSEVVESLVLESPFAPPSLLLHPCCSTPMEKKATPKRSLVAPPRSSSSDYSSYSFSYGIIKSFHGTKPKSKPSKAAAAASIKGLKRKSVSFDESKNVRYSDKLKISKNERKSLWFNKEELALFRKQNNHVYLRFCDIFQESAVSKAALMDVYHASGSSSETPSDDCSSSSGGINTAAAAAAAAAATVVATAVTLPQKNRLVQLLKHYPSLMGLEKHMIPNFRKGRNKRRQAILQAIQQLPRHGNNNNNNNNNNMDDLIRQASCHRTRQSRIFATHLGMAAAVVVRKEHQLQQRTRLPTETKTGKTETRTGKKSSSLSSKKASLKKQARRARQE